MQALWKLSVSILFNLLVVFITLQKPSLKGCIADLKVRTKFDFRFRKLTISAVAFPSGRCACGLFQCHTLYFLKGAGLHLIKRYQDNIKSKNKNLRTATRAITTSTRQGFSGDKSSQLEKSVPKSMMASWARHYA